MHQTFLILFVCREKRELVFFYLRESNLYNVYINMHNKSTPLKKYNIKLSSVN